MTTTTGIKVAGLRELGAAMLALKVDVPKASGRATFAAAKIVKAAAQANVRSSPSVATGSLLGAIITKKLPRSQSALTAEHIVTVRGRGKPTTKKGRNIDRAPYAFHVEFGTVNMPAEPFLRPALANNVGPAIAAMTGSLSRDIERAAKKAAKT